MKKKTPATRQPRATKTKVKHLPLRHASSIKGGGKAAGNVSGGWDLMGNKVHS